MDVQDWLSWDAVAKFATAVMLIRYWVEYTKSGLDGIVVRVGSWFKRDWHSPTFAYAIVSALALILAFGHAMKTPLTLDQAVLDFINAFVVAVVAGFMQKPSGSVEFIDKNEFIAQMTGESVGKGESNGKGEDGATVVKGFGG